MAFPIQVKITMNYRDPDYVVPPGVCTPWNTTDEVAIKFIQSLYVWMSEGVTDGVQWSDQVGVSIRRFSDSTSANTYIDYCKTEVWAPQNIPVELMDIEVTTLS